MIIFKQYNLSNNQANQYDMQINAITHYQTQAGTPRTKPLGSCNIAIGFRPGILLTSTLQVKQIRDQTRLRTPNDLVTTTIDSHQN